MACTIGYAAPTPRPCTKGPRCTSPSSLCKPSRVTTRRWPPSTPCSRLISLLITPLETVMILGDEASGIVRGIGVFTDRPAADNVNSDPEFAAFNDAVAAMLADSPKRVELQLLHLFTGE